MMNREQLAGEAKKFLQSDKVTAYLEKQKMVCCLIQPRPPWKLKSETWNARASPTLQLA